MVGLDGCKMLRVSSRVWAAVRVYGLREELLVSAITTGWISRTLHNEHQAYEQKRRLSILPLNVPESWNGFGIVFMAMHQAKGNATLLFTFDHANNGQSDNNG
jgi:hypothetical protein